MTRLVLLCGVAALAASASISRADSKFRMTGTYYGPYGVPPHRVAALVLRGTAADGIFAGNFICRPARRCFAARGYFSFDQTDWPFTVTFTGRAHTCEAQLGTWHLGAWQSPTYYHGPVTCDGDATGSFVELKFARPKSSESN